MIVYRKPSQKKWWHPFRFIFEWMDCQLETNKLSKTRLKESGVTNGKRETQIIVSLTSYPQRINTIHLDIRTLLNQTLKPDHVILTLAKEQFPEGESSLPADLVDLKGFGLEINWSEDIRSYKKLIPIYEEYKHHIIVTVDDDLYYSRDWLEKLYNSYLKEPNCIHCNVANAFFVDDEKNLYQVRDQRVYHKEASFLNSLVGFGGVLYPPGCLYKDITNKDLFMTLAPTNDDLWFWFMGILAGTKVRVIDNNYLMAKTIKETEGSGLNYYNNGNNDPFLKQMNNLFNHYPEVKDILLNASI